MKATLIWIIGGIVAFVVLVGIIFAVFLYLEPTQDKMMVETINGDRVLATEIIQQKQQEIDRLNATLDSLRRHYARIAALRDSIQDQINFKDNLIAQYRKTVETLNTELAQKNQIQVNIKELAKTYETMKVEDLRVLFSKLDDQTILLIYENVNPRNRKNILMALNASRAAAITQKLVKAAERHNS